jgi:hypothetical protein
MKFKKITMFFILIIILSISVPVFAAVTYTMTNHECNFFLYYDSNNIRHIWGDGLTGVNKSDIDEVNCSIEMYKNGVYVDGDLEYGANQMFTEAQTSHYVYDSSSYYDLLGVHHTDEYILNISF